MTRETLGDRLEHALDERADLEGTLDRGVAAPPRRRVVRTLGWLTLTGVSLYLVAPSLLETLSSWEDVRDVTPGWLLVMLGLQAGATVCLWIVQRIALHGPPLPGVATSQLAGNALSKIAPGGGAVGAALQFRMLAQAGIDRRVAAGGLAAANLLVLGIVLLLPVLALPAMLSGGARRELEHIAYAAIALAIVLFALGVLALTKDGPVAWAGRVAQRARNRVRPHAEPLRHLPERLLRERDRVKAGVGDRWKAALAAGIGRWVLDYASLMAALTAVGAHPRPGFVLLAFCAAQLLGQIPVTPGGLGFVEAGLTAMLGLAGVSAADAVLATFVYRLFSFWLPIPVGLPALLVHRRLDAVRRAVVL